MVNISTPNAAADESNRQFSTDSAFERLRPKHANKLTDGPRFSQATHPANGEPIDPIQLEDTPTQLEDTLAADTLADIDRLKQAIAHNDIATVKDLIKADVDLRPTQWDETPVLVTAAEKGYLEMVQMLVAANANVNHGYTQLPLHSAAAKGHLEIVKCLLRAGAHIHGQDGQGYTALMYAAAAGQLDIVRCLRSQGANLGTPGTSETALTLAQKAQQLEVCKFLEAGMQAISAPESTAVQDAVQAPPVETSGSVMDELIANTTAELNELLMSST